MARQDPLAVWARELGTAFPDLSKPQLKGLAEWSFGMALARCCCLDTVASSMADWLGQPELSVRSRLREWYMPAELKSGSKRGGKRQDLDVTTCFAPLLRWLVRDWPQPRLALALDASTLSERFVLLAVSVLYRSCVPPPRGVGSRTGWTCWRPCAVRFPPPGWCCCWPTVACGPSGCFTRFKTLAGIPLCASTRVATSAPTAERPSCRLGSWCRRWG
jgi:hypothetical protein